MIVVIGVPHYRATASGRNVDGLAARIALAAAAGNRVVQLVGKVGEDEAGEAVVLALAKGGVGHVALLRDGGRPTSRIGPSDKPIDPGDSTPLTGVVEPDEPPDPAIEVGEQGGATLEAADVDLALRYLTEFNVLVLADPAEPEVVGVVADAARWIGARLVVVAGEAAVPLDLPPDAIVFEAPNTDAVGVFASFVGSLAAALDEGEEPAEAFRSSVESSGWTPAPEA